MRKVSEMSEERRLFGNTENDPRSPLYNGKEPEDREDEQIECEYCEGTGRLFFSCCGDDIRGNDIDLCPTCHEHCDTEEGEECEECNGTGKLTIKK